MPPEINAQPQVQMEENLCQEGCIKNALPSLATLQLQMNIEKLQGKQIKT